MKPTARAELQAALGSALAKTLPEAVYLQLDAATLEEALTAAAASVVQPEWPYELAVERYLVDRLTALLRDRPRLSDQEIRLRTLDAAVRFDSLTAEQVGQNAARFEAYIRDGAEPDDRAEMLEELAPLFAVYAGWQNSSAVDPTEEQIAAGYISLLPADDAHAIDAACDAVEPLLPRIRRRLGIDPLRVSAEERSDDKSKGSSPSTDIEVG